MQKKFPNDKTRFYLFFLRIKRGFIHYEFCIVSLLQCNLNWSCDLEIARLNLQFIPLKIGQVLFELLLFVLFNWRITIISQEI